MNNQMDFYDTISKYLLGVHLQLINIWNQPN